MALTMNFKSLLALVSVICFSSALAAQPMIIAHRGAPGYLPEHTLESTVLAFSQSPDFIEQDLVLTKDKQLIVLHDIHLETVTNVEQVYPTRQREDGRYYALDFTLQELQQLRVHERTDSAGKPVFPQRYQGGARFTIATFEEHVELIRNLNRQFGQDVGFYPEIKAPAWHQTQGYDISKVVVDALTKLDLNHESKHIYVQCFDFAEVKRLRKELGLKTKLVQLIADNSWGESDTDYSYLMSEEGLTELSEYADGIGPWIPQLLTEKEGRWVATEFAVLAKAHHFTIHPYTHRIDQLPKNRSSDDLLDALFGIANVDGVFSDYSDVVRRYLDTH